MLENSGREPYEISKFTFPGKKCKFPKQQPNMKVGKSLLAWVPGRIMQLDQELCEVGVKGQVRGC